MSLIQNGGVGIFCLDKTVSANNSITLQPTFMYQSNSSLGIGTSNPQTTLDVAGDITSSNLFLRGTSLEFTGNNTQQGYSCVVTADSTSDQFSIAGYSSTASPNPRKIVLYDNVFIGQNLTFQGNGGGTSYIQIPSSGNFSIQSSSGTSVISISGNTVTIPTLVTSSPITPSITYNNGEYYNIAPNAISAFLYSQGNTYTNTVTTYSIPTPFFNCPNSTWECGNDDSSTPVTYKYARFVMNAFTSSGGNATSQNSVQCQILFKNASGVLVAYPDQGTTYFNIVDQGTSYGYCVNVSPWYLAVQGIGSPVFQNLDSSRTIQVGSTTMQFR